MFAQCNLPSNRPAGTIRKLFLFLSGHQQFYRPQKQFSCIEERLVIFSPILPSWSMCRVNQSFETCTLPSRTTDDDPIRALASPAGSIVTAWEMSLPTPHIEANYHMNISIVNLVIQSFCPACMFPKWHIKAWQKTSDNNNFCQMKREMLFSLKSIRTLWLIRLQRKVSPQNY